VNSGNAPSLGKKSGDRAFFVCWSGWLHDGFGEDFYLLRAGGAGDGDGAKKKGLAWGEDGGFLKDGLADDGVLCAEAGWLVGGAGLFVLGVQADGVGRAFDGGLDVQADIHVLDLKAFVGRWGGVGAGGSGDADALLQIGLLAGGGSQRELLAGDALAIFGVVDCVCEPVGAAGVIQVGDDLARQLQVLRGAGDRDGRMCFQEIDVGVGEHIVQVGGDVACVVLFGGVGEEDGL